MINVAQRSEKDSRPLGWIMSDIDPSNIYGPHVAALLAPGQLCPLGPVQPDRAAREPLAALTVGDLAGGRPVGDHDMARGCLAGLWLLHDFLDESHRISQDIETTTGSYWHGILHRREEDFDNAKYWFRRVGRHAVFEPLAVAACELAQGSPAPIAKSFARGAWDPFRFVDQCQAVAAGSNDEALLRQIAHREWQLLLPGLRIDPQSLGAVITVVILPQWPAALDDRTAPNENEFVCLTSDP
jgi:hypothetical protein